LLLIDVVVAEVVYVLESFYEVPRARVAELVRGIVAFASVVVLDLSLLLRALELYEVERLDFANAYRVASAETSGVGAVASFDRSIDRVGTVRRVEPQ
jgi:predicted nucleic-acid-binding protein